MKYIFLTDIEILTPLLDFDINGINIDLHNDFDFTEIQFLGNKIELYFSKILTNGNGKYQESNAVIIFSNVIEVEEKPGAHENDKSSTTIVNFSKGDLTAESKYYSDKNVLYFFIEFEDGFSLDIFCKGAVIFLW